MKPFRILLTLLLLFPVCSAVAQNDRRIEEQKRVIASLEKKIAAEEQQIAKLKKGRAATEERARRLARQIESRIRLMDETEKQAQLLREEIRRKDRLAGDLTTACRRHREEYAEMVRESYRNYRHQNYLTYLFSSRDFLDMARRIAALREIAAMRERKLEEITTLSDQVRTEKEKLAARPERSMWRYRELLPVADSTEPTPLRVGWSPLYEEPRLAEILGLKRLWVKDDGQNPTASLKDRASAMAVAKAREAGASVIACSSTGNAASSLAGNAAAAGLSTYIFVPSRAPKGKVAQLMTFGATVISVQGSYEETFELSKQAIDRWGWYNRNAAINPYLSEGKKTVALEIMEQLDWQAPDYIAISVGDGCTIAGLWKGLKDLYAIGFIDRLPRLISAQAAGCCPLNRSIETGEDWRPMEENTLADSIAVGVPRNADKALMAIRESDGLVVNVSDEEIMAAQKLLGRTCGVFGEPAGVTGAAGVKKLCEAGVIGEDNTVVSVVTGNGLKDVANAIKSCGEPISIPSDMDRLLAAFAERRITVD